jgi:D-lactate dehydrogenase
MKLVMFEMEPWERRAMADLQDGFEVEFVDGPLTAENVERYADAEAVSVFIYSDLGRAVLEQLPELRLVTTRSTGFDHIATGFAAERDIVVCNVPAYGDKTVAEHVFALLLALSHRLIDAVDRTRRGDFTPTGLTGFDLHGKTLGILGTGRIGSHVARIATGFGMNVLAFDVAPDEALAHDIGFSYASLDEVLRSSDVVTVHLPANDETNHLISTREFGLMRDGAVLINTSRGDIVHVQPLLRALVEGKLAGAGLDVLPEEPVIHEEAELLRAVYREEHDLSALLANHVLLHMRNVVITPHSAFNTREAVGRILEVTRDNLVAFRSGDPKNVVG